MTRVYIALLKSREHRCYNNNKATYIHIHILSRISIYPILSLCLAQIRLVYIRAEVQYTQHNRVCKERAILYIAHPHIRFHS